VIASPKWGRSAVKISAGAEDINVVKFCLPRAARGAPHWPDGVDGDQVQPCPLRSSQIGRSPRITSIDPEGSSDPGTLPRSTIAGPSGVI
jgi:hypothetical protein